MNESVAQVDDVILLRVLCCLAAHPEDHAVVHAVPGREPAGTPAVLHEVCRGHHTLEVCRLQQVSVWPIISRLFVVVKIRTPVGFKI